MRVVVTGSSGRIGRAICARLAATAPATGPQPRDFDVIGVDRVPGPATTRLLDLTDPRSTVALLQGAEALIHVAALHAPHVDLVPDALFLAVNVEATARLVEAAHAAGVPRIVFTSTTALYGHASSLANCAAWIDESTEPKPRTVYHRTKLQAEALLQEAARQGGPAVRILRMSRCFPEAPPLMAGYRLHRGIDARDVADAHACALSDPGAAPCATYVISAPTPFAPDDCAALWTDAATVIRQRAPSVAEAFAARRWALPTSIDRVYDASLAQRVLGWRARYDALAFMNEAW